MNSVAVVVLGCRISPDGEPTGASLRRCQGALEAWQQETRRAVSPLLVSSGGRAWQGQIEALSMSKWLGERGVPMRQLRAEARSLNTFENAWYSAQILRAERVSSLKLVTCDFHFARAARLFKSLGFQVEGFGVATPGAAQASYQVALRELKEAVSSVLQQPLKHLWDL